MVREDIQHMPKDLKLSQPKVENQVVLFHTVRMSSTDIFASKAERNNDM